MEFCILKHFFLKHQQACKEQNCATASKQGTDQLISDHNRDGASNKKYLCILAVIFQYTQIYSLKSNLLNNRLLFETIYEFKKNPSCLAEKDQFSTLTYKTVTSNVQIFCKVDKHFKNLPAYNTKIM